MLSNDVNTKLFVSFVIKYNILKLGDFTLKSGRKSPYFFNAGHISEGESLAIIGEYYATKILSLISKMEHRPTEIVLFGPAYKGISLVSSTSIKLAKDGLKTHIAYDRKEVKDHGESGKLIGANMKGMPVFLIDDVITSGGSVKEAAAQIKEAGGSLKAIVVSLDRQEKIIGKEGSALSNLSEELGVPVHSLIKFSDIINYFAPTAEELDNVAHSATVKYKQDHMKKLMAYRDQYGV